MKTKRIIIAAVLVIAVMISGALAFTHFNKPEPEGAAASSAATEESPAVSVETAQPSPEPEPGESAAAASLTDQLAGMTLDEKLWQMFVIRPDALTGITNIKSAGEELRLALAEYPVGGLAYFASNIPSTRAAVREMLANTQSYSAIPLFTAIDEEGGRVARITLSHPELGYEKVPPMEQIGSTGDPSKAYAVGEQLGLMLSDLGFNTDFAPVADVGTDSAAIGDRSFSDDSAVVAQMVPEVVKGLADYGVLSCLKHFPGHGSALADTHTGTSVTDRSAEDFRKIDFPPFEAGIAAGAEMIMAAHITAPSLDPTGTPASLSKPIMTDFLRGELGFEGLIVTDSLAMQAVTDHYTSGEAAIMAVKAGADIILDSVDFKSAHAELKAAVVSGEIPIARIDESVMRILAAKEKLNPFVDVHGSDWFYEDVQFVRTHDPVLFNGTSGTLFSPNAAMTREMLVTVLYRLEGQPRNQGQQITGVPVFTDVVPGSYYAEAVAWASSNGIVEGYGNGLFGVGDEITREDLAVILYRYSDLKGYDVSATADLTKFTDEGYIHGYPYVAVQWAVAKELLKGVSGNRLDPQGSATRAQVAAVLHRFTKLY